MKINSFIIKDIDTVFFKANLQKIYGKYKEKNVEVARLQPTLISLDYSKLLNYNLKEISLSSIYS